MNGLTAEQAALEITGLSDFITLVDVRREIEERKKELESGATAKSSDKDRTLAELVKNYQAAVAYQKSIQEYLATAYYHPSYYPQLAVSHSTETKIAYEDEWDLIVSRTSLAQFFWETGEHFLARRIGGDHCDIFEKESATQRRDRLFKRYKELGGPDRKGPIAQIAREEGCARQTISKIIKIATAIEKKSKS